ncbi:MAG: hypothetical protein FWC89_13380, partial [Defluviitaleaceae bacterium]|nr:hypothetical protein [Defluviitaleaceae bacterium]
MELNYRQIANIAQTYKTLFWEYLERDDGSNPNINIIPYIVNASLACEMYMKALIVHFDPSCTEAQLKKWGHKLDVLFNELPCDVKIRIKTKIPDSEIKKRCDQQSSDFAKIIQNPETTNEHREIIKKIIKNSPSTFDEMLSAHKNTFVEWRYYFGNDGTEKKYCSEWFLASFIMEL